MVWNPGFRWGFSWAFAVSLPEGYKSQVGPQDFLDPRIPRFPPQNSGRIDSGLSQGLLRNLYNLSIFSGFAKKFVHFLRVWTSMSLLKEWYQPSPWWTWHVITDSPPWVDILLPLRDFFPIPFFLQGLGNLPSLTKRTSKSHQVFSHLECRIPRG